MAYGDIIINGVDISKYMRVMSYNISQDPIELTTFGSTEKLMASGLMRYEAEVVFLGEPKMDGDGTIYIGDYKEKVKKVSKKDFDKKMKSAKKLSEKDRSLIF